MNELEYQLWSNIDGSFLSGGYRPGQRLVRGYRGTVTATTDADGSPDLTATAEALFARHNRDDRPDGRMCPSMSVGDVVQFGEVCYTVAKVGWDPVSLDPADLVTDRTWLEVVG